jgi:hypothetical protein
MRRLRLAINNLNERPVLKKISLGGVCFMVEKIIPWNVEVTNIDSYVCYKVRKLNPRNKIFQRKK